MSAATLRWGRLTARSTCSACGQPLPLTWLSEHVTCPYCHADQGITRELWERLVRELDEASDRGSPQEGTVQRGTRSIVYTLGPGAPSCERCDAPFPTAALDPEVAQNFACVRCGDPASTAPTPPWIREAIAPARQLIAVDPRDTPVGDRHALDLDRGPQPITMACPACGGGLEITTKSARILGCRYCRADVYLPDELWRRLHPVKRVEPLYVGFAGDSLWRRQRIAAEREAAQREAEAAERAQRRGAAAAAAAEAHQREVARLKRRAWSAALLHLGLHLAAAGVAFQASTAGGLLSTELLIRGGISLVIASVVTCYVVTRPIAAATGLPGEWLLFVTWFWLPFALVMPVVGQIMALIRALILAIGRFGSAQISDSSGSRHYEATRLAHGEGRPAALFFLVLALLWPLTLVLAAAPAF